MRGTGVRVHNSFLGVEGGTIQGGQGNPPGLALHFSGTSFGSINAGTFVSGPTPGITTGRSMLVEDSAEVAVRGGVFTQRWVILENAKVTVFGENIFFFSSNLRGTLLDGSFIDISVSKGVNAELVVVDIVGAESTSWQAVKQLYR